MTLTRLSRLSAFVIFLTCALSQTSHAVEVSLMAGTDFTKFEYAYPSDTLTQSMRPGLAFGAIATLPLMHPSVELEGGMVFMLKRPESSDTATGGTSQLSSLRGFQIPLLFRYSPWDLISLGVGGYYTQGFDRIQSGARATSSGGEPGYGATETSKADYGLVASAQLRVWLSYELRGLIDVRYLYGLADVDTTGVNSKSFTDIQVMVGMTIGTFR